MRIAIAVIAMLCGNAVSPPALALPAVTTLHGHSDAYRHAIECSGLAEWLWGEVRETKGIPAESITSLLQTWRGWRDIAIQMNETSAEYTEWDEANYASDLEYAYEDVPDGDQLAFQNAVASKAGVCAATLPK